MQPIDLPEPASQQASKTGIFQSPGKQRLVLCLLLTAATLALYSPVVHAPFLNFDDGVYVTDNPHVRSGLTWSTVVWAFRSTEATNWHPVTWLAHALDCQLFGLNPAGPHLINVLVHAINAILLFLLLEGATGFAWRSFAVAVLFALHPINVESVAWISERKNVLSMFFFLVALAAYGRYVRRPGVASYLGVTAAYAFGLMAKPQVITFPFALLLLDYWPLRRVAEEEGSPRAGGKTFWSLVWEKVPWFALSAASAIITMKVQEEARQVKLSPWIHLGNAAISYVRYIGKALWPLNLAAIYPHPELSISVAAAIASAAILVAVSAAAFVFRRERVFFVGWFWFLGTMVPMAGLVQVGVHSMADRYAYIPLLGVFVIVVWGAAMLVERLHLPRMVPLATSAIVFVVLAILLSRQVGFWQNNIKLWTHTLEITAANYAAEDNLATALLASGNIVEAVPHLRRALLYRPDDAIATLNLATYDQMRGDYQAAIEGYAKVQKFTTSASLNETASINSGYAHMSLGEYGNARRDFESARKLQPTNPAAYRGLGLAQQRSGDVAGAVASYQRCVELQADPVAYLLLAQALEAMGQADLARAAQDRAAALSSNLNDDIATTTGLLTH